MRDIHTHAGLPEVQLVKHFLAEPPFVKDMQESPGNPYLLVHYTYGDSFKDDGTSVDGEAICQGELGEAAAVDLLLSADCQHVITLAACITNLEAFSSWCCSC